MDINRVKNIEERISEANYILERYGVFKDESDDIKIAYDYISQQLILAEEYLEKSKGMEYKRKEFAKIRNKVFSEVGKRDGFLCRKCESQEDLTVDHIQALANGGENNFDNYQILCKSCNSKKHTKDNSSW